MVLRHLPTLGALSALACLACGGLPVPGAGDAPPPPPVDAPPAICEEPTCAVLGPALELWSEGGQLVVHVDGTSTGDRFRDGQVRAEELDGDPRKEVLISRSCGGSACLPDWWVLDCTSGGRCDEVPLFEGAADLRVVQGSNARHRIWWATPDGQLVCRELVRGRPEPCEGWAEVGTPPLEVLEPRDPPTADDDGKVVASADVDFDVDGRKETVACTWSARSGAIACKTTLHGVDATLPAAARVEILSTSTQGVLDVRANGRTGRWDGGGWYVPW